MEYIQSIKKESAEILTRYIELAAPKKILEVGTGEGKSGILMLLAAPLGCELVTIEKDAAAADTAKENFANAGLAGRVTVICGDAAEVLPTLSDSFDFIFLDGPKGQYINYLPRLVDLLRVKGILAADNVLFRGMVLDKAEPPHEYRSLVKNLRRFLNAINTDERLDTHLFYTGDGISISTKEKK